MSLFSDDSASGTPDGAIVGRLTSNLAALYTFLDHPILGVGPSMYYLDYSQKYANALGLRFFGEARRAHNMYLETAADTGVIGLASLMAVLLTTLVCLQKVRQYWLIRRPEIANMATSFLLAMIAYMGTAVFLHLSYLRFFTLLLALSNAAIVIFDREKSAARVSEIVPMEELISR